MRRPRTPHIGLMLALVAALTMEAGSAALAASQNMLDPAGPQARGIVQIWWVMAGGSALVLLIVMSLVLIGVLGRTGRRRRNIPERALIVGGGIVFPLIVLTALLVYALNLSPQIARAIEDGDFRVHVVAHQWWWEVRYPGLGLDGGDLISANEVRIPQGVPVQFTLESADVIHSFWVPNLGGKIDMIPGRTNRLLLQADRAGVYSGQCAEFCGLQHAFMSFFVRAMPQDEFDRWLAAERLPTAVPRIEILAQGHDAFVQSGCGACHTVRGTQADGTLGPDLTHVGSRLSIGAGVLPGNVGGLAGWIAGSQHIKPGNQMPSFNQLDGPSLRAIAHWLDSLE